MQNENLITASAVLGRFDERAGNEISVPTDLMYENLVPKDVLRSLYKRVDTCDFNELYAISHMLSNTRTRTAAFISGYCAAIDLTLDIMQIKSQGSKGPKSSAIYYGAFGSIQKIFDTAGLDELISRGSLSDAHKDLLCAEIIAASVNVSRDQYTVLHDFHADLESIRRSITTICEFLPEFMRLRKDGVSLPSVSEAIEVLEYIESKGKQHSQRVIDACCERGGLDREVLDLMLGNPSLAVSEGVL